METTTSQSSVRGAFVTSYLAALRPYAILSAGLFSIGAVAGIIALAWLPEAATGVEDSVAQFVQVAQGLGPAGLFVFIVVNNVVKAAVMMGLGLVFGLVPIFFLVSNGIVLSVAAALIAQQAGVWATIGGLLPHGVIEVPAVLLAAAVGLRLGALTIERLRRPDTKVKAEIVKAWRFFVALVLPALIVAALIETFVTPVILTIIRG